MLHLATLTTSYSGCLMVMIPFAFVLAYAVLGGVESGLPLSRWLRQKAARDESRRSQVAVGKAANLLLAGVVVAMLLTYPAALPELTPRLQTLWLVITYLLLLRALLTIQVFHRQPAPSWMRWALVATSLAVPAVMIQHVTVLLTGDANLLKHAGIAVALAFLAKAVSVALWSGYYYRPGGQVRDWARGSYLLALASAVVLLPLAFALEPQVLGDDWTMGAWPVVAGVLAGLVMLMWPVRRRYFLATVALAVGVGVGILAVQLPYLVRPVVGLEEVAR